ncbi:MAG: 4Fe-4S binding protein [Dehalococcoidales bacterium]|nr:4Fe-4S binding protein [Dehalococcoidales bacterium]
MEINRVTEMPIIQPEKCNGCGLCLTVCTCGALSLVNNRIIIVETVNCHWCTECEAVCPTGAIRCPFEIVIESGRSTESQ